MAISNLNPDIRSLIPDLMGGIGSNAIGDPQRPATNWLRPVHLSTGVRSTYVVPGDWPGKPDHWFAGDAPTYPMRKQNSVEYYIDGEPTFEAMVEAIETATGPEHFIVLLGWACHTYFRLSKSGRRCPGARRTLLEIIKERVDLGVLVRVLLYYNWTSDTEWTGKTAEMTTKSELDALQRIKPRPPELAKVRCILDDCIKTSGATSKASHHQKILLVYGDQGLIGFFGGVDFNEDRVDPGLVRTFLGPAWFDPHAPLHDVHMRVRGEAAYDLMVLATNRWNFSQPHYAVAEAEDDGKGGFTPVRYATGRDMEDMTILLDRARAKAAPVPGPYYFVKVAQTVGNPDLAKLQSNGIWPIVRHAIQEAKRFIYMEDQYLWSVDAAEELGKAAARLSHITILVPPDEISFDAEVRYRALKRMKEVAGAACERIRIYVISEPIHQYVHAKMYIIDDEIVVVGSANCNNRGYFTDSEVNGTIADPEWESKVGPRGGSWWALDMNLARKLRVELWEEHLRMPRECLVDGIAAEIHWRHPPANSKARIVPYTIKGKVENGQQIVVKNFLWHEYPYKDYEYSKTTDPKI